MHVCIQYLSVLYITGIHSIKLAILLIIAKMLSTVKNLDIAE